VENAKLEVGVDDKGPKKLGKTLNQTFQNAAKDARAFAKAGKTAQAAVASVAAAQRDLNKEAKGLSVLSREYAKLAAHAKEAGKQVERLQRVQGGRGKGGRAGAAAAGAAAGAAVGAGAGSQAGDPAAGRPQRPTSEQRQEERRRENESKRETEEQRKEQAKTRNMFARAAAFSTLFSAGTGSASAPFSSLGAYTQGMGHAVSPLSIGGLPVGALAGAGLSYIAGGMNLRQSRISRYLQYDAAARSAQGATRGVGPGTGPGYGMTPEEGLSNVANFTRSSGGNVVWDAKALGLINKGLSAGVAQVGSLTGAGGMGAAARGGGMMMSNADRQAFSMAMLGTAQSLAKQEQGIFGGVVTPAKIEEHLQRIADYTKQMVDSGLDADPRAVAGQFAGLQAVAAQNLGAGVNANTFGGARGQAALAAMRASTGEGGGGRMLGFMAALKRGENPFEALSSADSGNFGADELAMQFQGTFGRASGDYGPLDYMAKRMFGLNSKAGSGVARGDFRAGFGPVGGSLNLASHGAAAAEVQALEARAIGEGAGLVKGSGKLGNMIMDSQMEQIQSAAAMTPAITSLMTAATRLNWAVNRFVDLVKKGGLF